MVPNRGGNVALYLRVSTTKQASEGHGLDAQRSRLDEFIEAHGLNAVEVIVDEGASGSTLDREGMARVVELADSGAIDAVVVTKADRVSRSLRDLLNLGARLQERDVALITTDEEFDSGTPLGRAMASMRGVFAELERELIASRTREGMAAAKAKGVRLGRPPVGWRIEDGRWLPDERYPIVEQAHELRQQGMTLQAIADHFNDAGVSTGGSFGTWHPNSVRRLLKAPLVSEVAAAS